VRRGRKLTKLADIIIENSKSKFRVKDSVSGGAYPFFTSGSAISSFDDFICSGKNLFVATGGKACVQFYEGKAAYSTDCFSFTTHPDVDTKFLFHFLESMTVDIDEQMFEGAAIRHLQKSRFKDILVPLPPLLEQHRIVKLVDEALDSVTIAKVNAEKNLQNARALFECCLQTIFAKRGEDWAEKRLVEVSEDFGRGRSKHRPRNDPRLYNGEYPFIQTGDISNANHWVTSYSQTYNETGLLQSKLWPRGTICVAIVGATVGETAILDFDACFPDSVIGIVVNERLAHHEYLEYLLRSFKATLKEKGKGTARDNINLGTFENQRFPFPTLQIQKQIVSVLNDLNKEVQHFVALHQQKLAALEELKKSLLHHAFNGEL